MKVWSHQNPLDCHHFTPQSTTTGKDLDIPDHRDKIDMHFAEMVRKVNSKHVPPRTRFMLQDLLELRTVSQGFLGRFRGFWWFWGF